MAPLWTNTSTRAALPLPLGNQPVTRAGFTEFWSDLDTKAAFLGVANVFTVGQQISSGNLTLSAGNLVLGAAASKIIPGATSLALRNTADTADNLLITNAGLVTARAGVVVASADLTLTAGRLVFSSAVGKIVPGTTSLAFRDNADANNNLLVNNNGDVTVRGILNAASIPLLDTHAAAADPHPIYLTQTEGDARYALVAGAGITQGQADARYLQLTGGTLSGTLTLSTAASIIVPGATSFAIRNNANTANNVLVTDAGAVTTRAGLTVTTGGALVSAGDLTLTTGRLVLSSAAGKIVPGATSISLRNTADNADNLIITDAGNVTIRGTLATAGGDLSQIASAAGPGLLRLGTTGTDTNGLGVGYLQFQRPDYASNQVMGGIRVVTNGVSSGSRGGDMEILSKPDNNAALVGLTLTGATGNLTLNRGALVFSTAASKIIPGATSLSHRNAADSADNLLITDAGAVTTRAGLTVATGDVTLTAGRLVLSSAVGKIVPGATSISLRNTADSADNLIITDAGAVTVRNGLTISSGHLDLTGGGRLKWTGVASPRIVGGGTDFAILNNAENASNLIVTDAGAATFRALLTVSAGGLAVTGNTTLVATAGGTNRAKSAATADQALRIVPFNDTTPSTPLLALTNAAESATVFSVQKDGTIAAAGMTTTGGISIGTTLTMAQRGDAIYFTGDKYMGATGGVGSGGMQYYVGPGQNHHFYVSGDILAITSAGLQPAADNNVSCGVVGYRWTAVYAVNGTIQTSTLDTKQVLSDVAPGHALVVARSAKRVMRFHYLKPIVDEIVAVDDEAWPLREQHQEPDQEFEHVGFDADEVHPDLLVAPGQVNAQNTAVIALRAAVDVDDARILDRSELMALIAQLQRDVKALQGARPQ